MTGYMNQLYSYVYEGRYPNGEADAVPNGVLMVLDPATKTLKYPAAADTNSKFLVAEDTVIYDGVEAYDITVEHLAARYYFVEQLPENFDTVDYDLIDWVTKPGKRLRAHELQPNDKFYVSKGATALTVGNFYGVTTKGLIG